MYELYDPCTVMFFYRWASRWCDLLFIDLVLIGTSTS